MQSGDKFNKLVKKHEEISGYGGYKNNNHDEVFEAAKISNLMPEYEQYLKNIKNRGGRPEGKTTGFVDIDVATGGFRKKVIWVIGGASSTGKSALAIQFCVNSAIKDSAKIGFFSMEMSKEDVINRLLGCLGNIPVTAVRNGLLEEKKEIERFETAKEKLANYDIYVFDSPLFADIEKLKDFLLHLKDMGSVFDLIVLDHLSHFSYKTGKNDFENRTSTMYALQSLAKDVDTCILLLSQVSISTQKSSMDDQINFLGSGEILNCAEVAIYLSRDIFNKPDKLKFKMVKNRNGPILGIITFDYAVESQRIYFTDPVDELNAPLLSGIDEDRPKRVNSGKLQLPANKVI